VHRVALRDNLFFGYALTGDIGITVNQVGKIDIFDFSSYVALDRTIAHNILKHLQNTKNQGSSI